MTEGDLVKTISMTNLFYRTIMEAGFVGAECVRVECASSLKLDTVVEHACNVLP